MFTPASVSGFIVATLLAALTYGVLGLIAGTSLDRLSGVYLMLFAPSVDVLLFQNPIATDSPTWVRALPGCYVTRATMDAAFTTGIDPGNFVGATGYLLAALTVGVVVLHRVSAVD